MSFPISYSSSLLKIEDKKKKKKVVGQMAAGQVVLTLVPLGVRKAKRNRA